MPARGVEALEDIFSGEPPGKIRTSARDERCLPTDWQILLQDAEEYGVLDAEGAERWRRCILEDAFRDSRSDAKYKGKFYVGWLRRKKNEVAWATSAQGQGGEDGSKDKDEPARDAKAVQSAITAEWVVDTGTGWSMETAKISWMLPSSTGGGIRRAAGSMRM